MEHIKALYDGTCDENEKPLFEHEDCPHCIFLGSCRILEHKSIIDADLYIHKAEYPYLTVIARYSSEPSDYSSGAIFSFHDDSQGLKEARLRALARDIITNEEILRYHPDWETFK
jgi:hypothetical protein